MGVESGSLKAEFWNLRVKFSHVRLDFGLWKSILGLWRSIFGLSGLYLQNMGMAAGTFRDKSEKGHPIDFFRSLI